MGAVNIDNTGSGSAVTLSSDGTDLLLNGSPIGGGASAITISNKTGAYTVVAGDLGTIINCTSGTFTVALTAAATLGSGFNCWVWNTGTGTITIDPASTETIDGISTLTLRRGEGTQIVCDGTNWQTGDKKTMRGYSDNIANGTTKPSASGTNSVAIGPLASASNTSALALGFSALATGDTSLAVGYGWASAQRSIAISPPSGLYVVRADSTNSVAIGLNSGNQGSQTVTGSGAMALGGSYASGTDSFAAAVANNTSSYGATNANSIAIGDRGIASGSASLVISTNTATSSGVRSIAIGSGVQATQTFSVAIGSNCVSSIIGKFAYSGNGSIGGFGTSQTGMFVLMRQTSDATATVLTTDNTAPGTTDQVILPNNSAYAFTGTVVARQQASGGTASAAWKVEGLIRREANAASTVLVASTVTAIDNTPGWTLALSADTTNGGLKIEATGAAATNIRWVATVQTSEVTY